MVIISLAVIAYLLGSIPTAVWVGKIFFGVDVRTHGSGNAGATNTIRVLGWKAGVPVLIFDVLKAWIAVKLPIILSIEIEGPYLVYIQLMLGALAVAGHVFPLFAGFRGGKGVASITGIVIALFPGAFFVVLGIFIVLLILFRYVSLASVISSVLFPFVAVFIFKTTHTSLLIFSILVAIIVPVLHRKNIIRLRNGTESKFVFRKTG